MFPYSMFLVETIALYRQDTNRTRFLHKLNFWPSTDMLLPDRTRWPKNRCRRRPKSWFLQITAVLVSI